MTLVAALHSADGVLMGADCRVTVKSAGASPYGIDDVAKLVKLGTASVIGCAGDLPTVAWLYSFVFGPQRGDRRPDAVSVSIWLPRVLRGGYKELQRLRYPVGDVSFLVGGTIPGRKTIMRWLDLALWAARVPKGFDDRLVARLEHYLPAAGEYVEVPASSASLLYRLSSPHFEPVQIPPLDVAAIGSGRAAALEALLRDHSLLVTARPDRCVAGFVDALGQVLGETPEPTVGGALLAAYLVNGKVKTVGIAQDLPDNGGTVAIGAREGRFFVRTSSGEEMRLRYPGEAVQSPPKQAHILSDFRAAQAAQAPRRKALLERATYQTRFGSNQSGLTAVDRKAREACARLAHELELLDLEFARRERPHGTDFTEERFENDPILLIRDSLLYRAESILWHLDLVSRNRAEQNRRLERYGAALEATMDGAQFHAYLRRQHVALDDVLFGIASLCDYLAAVLGSIHCGHTLVWAELVSECTRAPSRVPSSIQLPILSAHGHATSKLCDWSSRITHRAAEFVAGETNDNLDASRIEWRVWFPERLAVDLRPLLRTDVDRVELVDALTAIVEGVFTTAATIAHALWDPQPSRSPWRAKKTGAVPE